MNFYSVILALVIFISVGFTQDKKIVVVIDPGHGGRDFGHLAIQKEQHPEKVLNLLIAQKLGTYLSERLANVEVHYTRRTDTYSSLGARVDYMNNLKADYVLSIHCNGSSKGEVKGTETHIHDRRSSKSYLLAKEIEREFSTRAGRYSRGIKDGDDRGHSIQLLKYTQMPTVLIECGFLTNTEEAKFLNSGQGQDYMASAIFRAFRSFLKKQHPKINFEKTSSSNYRIQIMSSKTLISSDPSFIRLGQRVDPVRVDSKSTYKYKYFVGHFETKKEAEVFLEMVKKKGFPDAFVVRMK